MPKSAQGKVATHPAPSVWRFASTAGLLLELSRCMFHVKHAVPRLALRPLALGRVDVERRERGHSFVRSAGEFMSPRQSTRG